MLDEVPYNLPHHHRQQRDELGCGHFEYPNRRHNHRQTHLEQRYHLDSDMKFKIRDKFMFRGTAFTTSDTHQTSRNPSRSRCYDALDRLAPFGQFSYQKYTYPRHCKSPKSTLPRENTGSRSHCAWPQSNVLDRAASVEWWGSLEYSEVGGGRIHLSNDIKERLQ